MRIPKVLHHPPKKWTFGPKTAKLCPKLTFLAKYRHFGPFGLMAEQKRCQQGAKVDFHYVGIKTFASSQKRPNFAQKWLYWPNIGHFWAILSHAWTKNDASKVFRWFSVIWVPKLLLIPIKIRNFVPKKAKFGQKYDFLVILGQMLAFLAHFVPCPTKKQCKKRWLGGSSVM